MRPVSNISLEDTRTVSDPIIGDMADEKEEAVPATPEDQKSLLRNMRRYFREDMDEKLGDISTNLMSHRAFCEQEFDSIQKTFSKHGKAI